MTTHILGINAFHADAAAVLLRDGEVVGALAEERLNRIKQHAGFPRLAVRRLLEMGGISLQDVDHIAVARDSSANLAKKLAFSVRNLGRIARLAELDFSRINIVLAIYLVAITLTIDGLVGLAVLMIGSGLGWLTVRLGVERITLMGAIILPTMLLLFGM